MNLDIMQFMACGTPDSGERGNWNDKFWMRQYSRKTGSKKNHMKHRSF